MATNPVTQPVHTPATIPTWVALLGEIVVEYLPGTYLEHVVGAMAAMDATMTAAVIRIAHTIDNADGRIRHTYVAMDGRVIMNLHPKGYAGPEIFLYSDGYIALGHTIDPWGEGDGTLLRALGLIRKYASGE